MYWNAGSQYNSFNGHLRFALKMAKFDLALPETPRVNRVKQYLARLITLSSFDQNDLAKFGFERIFGECGTTYM